MQSWINLALNGNYKNVSALCRRSVCIILRSASRLRSVSVLVRSDHVQLSVSACPACRMTNFRCEVCAQGEEVKDASWCIRGVLREMRK